MQFKYSAIPTFLTVSLLFAGTHAEIKAGTLTCFNGLADNILRTDWDSMIARLRTGQGIPGIADDPFSLGSQLFNGGKSSDVSFFVGTAGVRLEEQQAFIGEQISFNAVADIIEEVQSFCCPTGQNCIGGSGIAAGTSILVQAIGFEV